MVLGINLVCDVGMVRILDPGPWPHVEMGDSLRMGPGDPCLLHRLRPSQEPGSTAERRGGHRHCVGDRPLGISPEHRPFDPFNRWRFRRRDLDADGRLVAIHQALGSPDRNGKKIPHKHVRVEVLREHWDELNAPFDQTIGSALATAEGDLNQVAAKVGQSVVEVLDGQNPVALGTM